MLRRLEKDQQYAKENAPSGEKNVPENGQTPSYCGLIVPRRWAGKIKNVFTKKKEGTWRS